MVKTTAPTDILELYESNILEGTNAFLKYLKDEIIKEFKLELSGSRDSESAVSNAATILQAAEDLMQSSTSKPKVPEGKPLGHPKESPTIALTLTRKPCRFVGGNSNVSFPES